MTLYGRDDLVERLAWSEAAVTVIAGDSGVGKSEVLAAVQRRATEEGQLASGPITLARAPGAFQRGLLSGLGQLVAGAIKEQGRAAQIVGHLRDAIERLVETKGQELARVLGRELVVLARARLGDEFGRALADYASELKSSVDERLGARIDAATDQGVVGLLAEFAAEVCSLTDGPVSVALDGAEQLDDADQRVLADLHGWLPPGFRVRAAFATYTGDHVTRTERLRAAGAALHRITGIDDEAVRLWLVAEGLNTDLSGAVLAATAGYPLHVGDAVRHLKTGGSLNEAPLNQQFAQRTSETWNELDIEVASHARSLAVFVDPPGHARLAPFLGLTPGQYGEVEERLWRARVFSVEVNGQRWFHEQRRRFILEQLLSGGERAEANKRGAEEVWDQLKETNRMALVGPLSDLVIGAPEMRREKPTLGLIADLPQGELAIGAALLELTESSTLGVEADGLIRHARDTFGGQGNLVVALRGLAEKGLIFLDEREHSAGIEPTAIGEPLAAATLAGRAARDLARSPVPRVASLFFAEIDGHTDQVVLATYGVGSPSMPSLAGAAAESRRAQHLNNEGLDLLLRGRIAERPVYGAVAFQTAEARNEAFIRLRGLRGQVLGEPYEIDDLLALPTEVVASRRFLQAAARLVGHSLGGAYGGSTAAAAADTPLTPRAALDLRVRTMAVCRELMDSTERYATDMDRALKFYVHGDTDDFVQVEVIGGPEVFAMHEMDDELSALVGGPYWLTQLEEALELKPGENIKRMQMSSGPLQGRDPIVETLHQMQETAAAFNQHQTKRVVPLEAQALERMLTRAARRELADAERLAQAIPLEGAHRTAVPRTTYVLVPLGSPLPGVVPGAFTVGRVRHVPNPGGEEEVIVALVEAETDGGITTARVAFEDAFGFPDTDKHGVPTMSGADGDVRTLITELMGHAENELAFMHPDKPGLAL